MESVFWDAHGISFIDYLEKGKTIKTDYCITLLVRLSVEIKKERPHMLNKKLLFHEDNAPCHKSMKTMIKLNELSFELQLFADLEKLTQVNRFGSNKDVIAETEAYFESKDDLFLKKGIGKLEKLWNECITLKKICPLRGHILIARFARSSQV